MRVQRSRLVLGAGAGRKVLGRIGGVGGHAITKSDGEPAVVAFEGSLGKQREGVGMEKRTHKGESQNNGRTEDAGEAVR